MLLIERAKPEDVTGMLALANQAAATGAANFATEPEPLAMWQEAFAATSSRYPWLVARGEAGGAIVGFAKAGPHRARGAYAWTAELTVYVDEGWQGRRVGSALYAALVPTLRAQGFVMLLAGITTGHLASERLHARLGMTRCATFHRAGWKLGAWHDVGYWELALRPRGAPPPALAPVADVPFVRRVALGSAVAEALVAELNAELGARYPEDGATHFELDEHEVAPGRGAFVVADLDGAAVGCGAVRLGGARDGDAELKRMYVRPAARGKRVAAVVLDALELEARLLGARRLVLETGVRQAEALRLYARAGYTPIPAWGAYAASPLSLCYAKPLA